MILTAEDGMLLGPISWVFGKMLEFLYNLFANGEGVANLGLIIIIFTVLVKIMLFPLTFKQQKSSKINSYIQPEIQKIQKKYKDKKDQESMMRQNEEIQAVYKKYGTGMASGCLPTLIQFPIIIALYRVIQNIPAYVSNIKAMYEPIATTFMGLKGYSGTITSFVNDNAITTANIAVKALEKADPITTNHIIDIFDKFNGSQWNMFREAMSSNTDVVSAIAANVPQIEKINEFILGINILDAPGWKLSWALLIPLSSGLFNFLSSKVMQTSQPSAAANDMSSSMMKSMLYVMPIMSVFICVSMPAGVGIYWSMSAFISVVTQVAINFYYDHTDMEVIIAKNVAKAEKKAAKKGGKKSFMDRMMESATGVPSENMTEEEKREYISKISSANLRNYDSTSSTSSNASKGSLASKANIMRNYDEKDKGGDK